MKSIDPPTEEELEIERLKAKVNTLEWNIEAAEAMVELNRNRAKSAELEIERLKAEVGKERQTRNAAYSERNQCVVALVKMALALGFEAGKTKHAGKDWEEDWRNVVFADLPSGQVSWHFHDSEWELIQDLPDYQDSWDGHTTEQKYNALKRLSVRILAAYRIRARSKKGKSK